MIDFAVDGPRDFAPERSQNVNVYEAVVAHAAKLKKAGKKVIFASYSAGSRERLAGLLDDHGLSALSQVGSWQEALGAKNAAQIVLPLDHGFTAPDVAVLTEQDMLGDRLVRRKKKRKSADAFLAELAALTPGDLVVHSDHGIARYEGPDQGDGRQGAARLRRAQLCRRRQALRPGREYRRALALRSRTASVRRSTGSAARHGSGASRG